jgi:hypothetical protein
VTGESAKDRMNEDKLGYLHDVVQLQTLKAIYCEAVDDCVNDGGGAAARLRELFTEDATGDYGTGVLRGRDALIEFLVNSIKSSSDSAWHAIHSPRIEIDGDTGVGRWTIMVRRKARGSSEFETIIGRYLDEFRRTANGWRIRGVRFIRQG